MNAMLLLCCGCAVKTVKCDCDLVAATTWQDVAIVFCICAAIVVIATYGTCRFFKNKEKEREFQKGRESQKHNWDVEDKNRKQTSDELNRSWQLDDEARKQKEGLLSKKLEMLHELCYIINEDNLQKVLKGQDSIEVKDYLSALDGAIGITPKPQEAQTKATPEEGASK